MMTREPLEDRADRLIQHRWLTAIVDLVADMQQPDLAREMIARNGISREMMLASGLEPHAVRVLLPLYPRNEARGFVNGNDDLRTVRVGGGGPVDLIAGRSAMLMAARYLREEGDING